MKYILAKPEELSKWQKAANDVAEIMRLPDMANNANFLDYAVRKLGQNEAIMAYDEENDMVAGFIGFSRSYNRITWLGVIKAYRRRGVGSGLIVAALDQLNANEVITVKTYPGNYLPGEPARNLYFKHGFVETTGEVIVEDGLEMVEFSLKPKAVK